MRNNQKGMSLPIVLGITALVTANIYFFMGMDKKSKTENRQSSARVQEQAEKRRVSSLLADYQTCNMNLAGKTIPLVPASLSPEHISIIPLDGLELKTATDNVIFLKENTYYIEASHKVRKFYLEYTDTTLSPSEFSYSLTIEYEIPESNDKLQNLQKAIARKNAIIKIPLYVEKDKANPTLIGRCYARPEEITSNTGNSIETAIKEACLGETAYFRDNNLASPTYKVCEHFFKPIGVLPTPLNKGDLLNGVSTNGLPPDDHLADPGSYTFEHSGLVLKCPDSPVQQYFTGIANSVGSCDDPPKCIGAMMIRDGNTFACSTNCAPQELHNSMLTKTTPKCYSRQKPCGPGEFTTHVYANGDVSCAPIVYKNKACPPGQYAVDLDPTIPSAPIICRAYSKVKNCSLPSRWSYISSLTAHPNPSCYSYNY